MNSPTALLMLKAPVAGEVKTRLARDIGPAAAARVYRRIVEQQMREIPPTWCVRICFAPAEAEKVLRDWLGESCAFSPQVEGDLGARLAHAVATHFAQSAQPVLILGGDCPYSNAARLLEAAAALSRADAVVVPAADGGYCLLGLRRGETGVFRDIAWSTPRVLAQTRQRLRECGLTWIELETLEDVDDGASWQRALENFPHLREDAQ